jgi:putative FmdB family regulatory protein
MPTYEYRCRTCGEELEVVQSFKDDPLTVCPNCAGELKKVFSPIGISFKGSGFYRNDSRSSSSKGERKSETKAESGTSPAKDSKGESSSGKDSSKSESSSSSSSTPAPAPKATTSTS